MVAHKVTWIALTRRSDKYILTAMAGDTAVKEHEWKTKAELQSLLAFYPGAGTAVPTTETWVPEKEAAEGEPVQAHLRLVRTGKKEARGCEELFLTLGDQSWIVRSGQPWAQVFQKGGPENRPGSMMPLPGGDYSVGPVEWAGGKGNYSASFGEGLGPVWVGVQPKFSTKRSAFGAHIDSGAYSTAGCIGLRTEADLKSFVAAMDKFKPKLLQVVWS